MPRRPDTSLDARKSRQSTTSRRAGVARGAPVVAGTRSAEQLHHFHCGACHKWWSIGDAPERSRWFCPWCGRENVFADGAEPSRSGG